MDIVAQHNKNGARDEWDAITLRSNWPFLHVMFMKFTINSFAQLNFTLTLHVDSEMKSCRSSCCSHKVEKWEV